MTPRFVPKPKLKTTACPNRQYQNYVNLMQERSKV